MTHEYNPGDEPVPGYRVVRFLGRGAFGAVWQAIGPGGIHCALKIISLSVKEGYKEFRAIRLVKLLRHPNLTPIIAFWLKENSGHILDGASEPGSAWLRGNDVEVILAMGLGDKSLYDRLQECRQEKQPGIPPDELLNYMEAAAKAIDFLNQPTHDLGFGPIAIQHCDIKPQNILIVSGEAQVCDFGLARPLNDARKTSTVAGSYAYIAPEAIENKSSKTNDQYSLAISYAELRTGELPFIANTLYEVMFAHLQGKLDFSKLSASERTVLKRATALNPDQRFPNCMEMVRALRKAIEEPLLLSVEEGPEGETPPPASDSLSGFESAPLLENCRTVMSSPTRVLPSTEDVLGSVTLLHAEPAPAVAPSSPPKPEEISHENSSLVLKDTHFDPPIVGDDVQSKQATAPVEASAAEMASSLMPTPFVVEHDFPENSDVEIKKNSVADSVPILAKARSAPRPIPKNPWKMAPVSAGKVPKRIGLWLQIVIILVVLAGSLAGGIWVPRQLRLHGLSSLINDFEADVRQGKMEAAAARLERLRETIDTAGAGNQAAILSALAKTASALLGQALKDARKVQGLILDLNALPFETRPYELSLAEAICKQNPTAKQLLEVLGLQKHIAAWPGDGAAQVREAYCRLVTQLVRKRLPELEKPADYEDLRPLCREAQECNKADAVTLACLCECLLLRQEPPTAADLDLANAIDWSNDLPLQDRAYVLFVQALLHRLEPAKLQKAAAEMREAFAVQPGDTSWRNGARRRHAALLLYQAGSATHDRPEVAYHFFQAANEIQPSAEQEYQEMLLVAASRVADGTVFIEALKRVLDNNGIERWKEGDAALALAQAFCKWADRGTNFALASQNVGRIGPALEAALRKHPQDTSFNYWMGSFHWQRRTPSQRQDAYKYFGKSLAAVENRDELEDSAKRIQAVIGEAPVDYLEVLDQAIPVDRAALKPRHVVLLVRRAKLILDNRQLLEEDLKRSVPRSLADAEDVTRLQDAPSEKAAALAIAYSICLEVATKGLASASRKQEYESKKNDYYARLADLFLEKETYNWTSALDWAPQVSNYFRGKKQESKAKIVDSLTQERRLRSVPPRR